MHSLLDTLLVIVIIIFKILIDRLEKRLHNQQTQISGLYLFIQRKFDITPAEISRAANECTDEDLAKMDRLKERF